MALIQTSLIWVTYAVAIGILLAVTLLFQYIYQSRSERALSVTIVSTITISFLLATVLLLPVDVALTSSTVRSAEGIRKDWATQDQVDSILLSLKVVYYVLFSIDAFLCLLACPFVYFYYEEYDEVAASEGNQTILSRVASALKYTIIFVVLCVILVLVGLFVPVVAADRDSNKDLDYFKDLLTENRGERTLTFVVGLLMTIGTVLYVVYTATGLALLPVALIKTAPTLSMPKLAATTATELDANRERQHQLEARNEGRQGGLDARDQRELEQLVRDERTLIRRERLAAEASGDGHPFVKFWNKAGAVLRPLKLLFGLLLFVLTLVIWTSMLITGIDKAANSVCKTKCGYILGHINIFQPLNYIFVMASKVFPIDYILYLLLVVLLFSSTAVGIASVSIRFLWIEIFKIRKGRTTPQALLVATVMMALIALALNYSLAVVAAPQYTTFGAQTYCDRPASGNKTQPDCSDDRSFIKPCSELATNPAAKSICTPSVASSFINRITLNFPFFGVFDFWATFFFLGVYLIVAITALVRVPRLDTAELDAELEEEEEEGLIASTGRRFNATWQDITGRAAVAPPSSS